MKTRDSADRQLPSFNEFQLYKLVCRKGGCQSVTNRNEWQNISDELQVKDSKLVHRHYRKYLYAYERKHYFGVEDDEEEPVLISMLPRKMTKVDAMAKEQGSKIRDENYSLESELAKNIEEDLKERESFYLNKNKLSHSKAENKRIILGLDSFMGRREAIYSLNMLLLYSVNSHQPFLLENNEKIFHAISSYAHSLYPPQNEENKEHLRTIICIFRNLTMNAINLKFILGTPIFALFVQIFNQRLDSECSKNIVDIMTGLVKVGWDCGEIISEIEEAVLEDRCEDVENSIDLLRGLIDEREENMIVSVRDRLNTFIRVLLSTEISIDIKEQVLEILSFVSDANADARLLFCKNHQLLGILIGILQHMRNQEKLTQFAALTLSSISAATGSRHELSFFETELIQIGFTDDSLAGIIANILADIASI